MILLKALIRLLFVFPVFISTALYASPKPLNLLPHTVTNPVAIHPSHETLPWLQQHPEIRIASWLPAHPPFVIDNGPAHFEGLTADYVALLQQALPVRFSILQYPDQQAALQALRQGEVELIAGNQALASDNADLDSSISYLQDRAVLLHQPQIAVDEEGSLKGKTLIYIGNERLREVLKTRYPDATLAASDDYYEAMASVVNDENVVMWLNEVTAAEINERLYENHLRLTPSDAGANLSLNFISRRDNAMLIAAIDDAIGSVSMQNHAEIANSWRLGNPTGLQHLKLALSSEESHWVSRHPVVPVLIVNSHIPLTFADSDGEVSGYAIALLKRIGQQSGLKYTFRTFNNLSEMRAHLKSHPDSLIAVADAAASQDDDIIFSRPYQISSWVLVTKKKSAAVKSLSDMAGKKVAVFTGSYYLPDLRARYPEVNFVESDFSLGTVVSMLTQNVDGAIVPQSGASFVLKSYLSDRFKIAAMLPIPPLKLAMATGKDNVHLLSVINKALVEIPPRSLDAQLSGWQMRYALDRFEIWGRYRNIIFFMLGSLALITVISVVYFWRNRFLKRTLVVQQKLSSELEIARSKLEKVSESKSTFLSQMSHEIRTPMNALIGLLELESRGRSSPEQRQNNIDVAYDSAKSLLVLVGDILDIAKIESGTFIVRSVPLSLSETMNSITTLFRHCAEEKGLSLQTRVEVVNDRILFDPVMLKQIISNLLSNAIKFTAEGEVEAVIYQAAKGVSAEREFVLEVTDSGPGLTPEQQKTIFEPFVQVEDNPAAHQGTGLGLSICRQLAGLLNGQLQVESELGEGTTFIFRFPAQLSSSAPSVSENSSVEASGRQCKILVVDDHPPNRLLLSQQLAFAGHTCVAAENGHQALRIWSDEQPPFDIVITDCNMPGISGFELVSQLREREKRAGHEPRPMFGLTAMAEQEVISRAKASGMTDCLFKPIQLDRLLARMSPADKGAGTADNIDRNVILSMEKLARSQPDKYRQLIELMIKQNRLDINALQVAVAAHDFNRIKQLAHSLKGGARLTDAIMLADIAGDLEKAAEIHDDSVIQTLIQHCEEQVSQLESELRRELSERIV